MGGVGSFFSGRQAKRFWSGFGVRPDYFWDAPFGSGRLFLSPGRARFWEICAVGAILGKRVRNVLHKWMVIKLFADEITR